MSYLIGQMIWALIIVAVLSIAIGWWMRSVSHESQVRVLKADHDARQQALTRARDDLRDQLEQVAATRADGQLSAEARTRITEHIRTLEKENAQGQERWSELTARLSALNATSKTRDEEYENLRHRLAEVTARLRSAEAAPAPSSPELRPQADTPPDVELVRKLESQADQIAQLRERLASAESIAPAPVPQVSDEARQEHAKLLGVIQAQKRTIEQLSKRPKPEGSTGDTGQQPALHEVGALRAALRARDAEIALLREQISAASRGPAGGAGASEDLFATPPEGLLNEPQGSADDLKKINGIGPVLETKLNDLGVFHFHQIAGFSEDDIGWIASQMNAFPNRILRDRWVAQAADLARNG